jgi:hypothetical protein
MRRTGRGAKGINSTSRILPRSLRLKLALPLAFLFLSIGQHAVFPFNETIIFSRHRDFDQPHSQANHPMQKATRLSEWPIMKTDHEESKEQFNTPTSCFRVLIMIRKPNHKRWHVQPISFNRFEHRHPPVFTQNKNHPVNRVTRSVVARSLSGLVFEADWPWPMPA